MNEEQPLLEIKFQSKLNNPHCRPQTPDFAYSWPIRGHRRRTHKAQVVRLPKERSVQGVKQLAAELQLEPLRYVEVLERRCVQVPLAWRYQNIPAGAPVVAKVLPARDIA